MGHSQTSNQQVAGSNPARDASRIEMEIARRAAKAPRNPARSESLSLFDFTLKHEMGTHFQI